MTTADAENSVETPSYEIGQDGSSRLDHDDVFLRAALELALFTVKRPVTESELAAKLGQDRQRIARQIAALIQTFEQPHHGLRIETVAGGYRGTTKPEYHEFLKTYLGRQKAPAPLTTQALETLALIALKQPISAAQINDIRGVKGAGALKTLLHRKLIVQAPRRGRPGRGALYRTTRQFLIEFGLNRVDELFSSGRFAGILRLPPGLRSGGTRRLESWSAQ